MTRVTHQHPLPPESLRSDIHEIDVVALDLYLGQHFDDGFRLLTATRLIGGASNPTYVLGWGDTACRQRFILRKKPPGKILPSAHQIEREYRVIAALASTDVPVPRVRLLCEDPAIIGTPFYVMDFLEGRVLADSKLPDLAPSERAAIYASFAETLARLHRVDIAAVGLSDFGRPGNYFERQTARWTKQYRAAQSEPIAAMEHLIAELPKLIPAQSKDRIVHGDFRLENVMLHPVEPRVIALLDWELATLGDPIADLGYACIAYHADLPGFGSLVGTDFAASGIPDRAQFVEAYCQGTGLPEIADLDFTIAFALFRLAAIAQGVYRRGLDGVGTGHASELHNAAPLIAASGVAMLEVVKARP